MIDTTTSTDANVDSVIRRFLFERAAATGVVPQASDIAAGLDLSATTVDDALKRLAAAKVLILAPNGGDIWAANPFCAVPSGIRVNVNGTQYWAICAWDALGIVAAVRASSATVRAPCGDCGEMLELEFKKGELSRTEGLIHFAVPARAWWKNIGFA